MPSKIEWVKNEDGSQGETWNLISGCTKESAGCKNCYAERMTARLKAMGQAKYSDGFNVVKVHPECLDEPLRWRKPRTVFVCSMADLFHVDVPFEFIAAVFGVMAACPQHTFQVLTKRAGRMLEFFRWLDDQEDEVSGYPCRRQLLGRYLAPMISRNHEILGIDWPLPNVQLLVSCEDQPAIDARVPYLLQCPAAVRGVSVEPMVGGIDLTRVGPPAFPLDTIDALRGLYRGGIEIERLDWVICGGESGPGARPMHPEWARSLRDQCEAAGVPFLFKQWGEWSSEFRAGTEVELATLAYNQLVAGGAPDGMHTLYTRVGKKVAGRELDGVIHDAFPKVRT